MTADSFAAIDTALRVAGAVAVREHERRIEAAPSDE